MPWTVIVVAEFEDELAQFERVVRNALLAQARLLQEFGPQLGRPHADTLYGSRYANMKELRFDAGGGAWRVAFAFDPKRRAVLLVAGDKSGSSTQRFYRQLIAKADRRYGAHLRRLAAGGGKDE